MKEQPNYYGIIPADVRYCCKICANSKLLYSELTALTNKEGYCYASNNYFAELYNVHKNTVSKWFSLLEKNGFIRMEVKENYRRKVWINEKLKGGNSKAERGDKRKAEDNSTSNNNKKEYYTDEMKELFETWLNIGLSQHKESVVKNNISKKHSDSFKQYGLEIWKIMISDYHLVYNSSEHYYSHWCSFWDFIGHIYKKFLPELKPVENMSIKGNDRPLTAEEIKKQIQEERNAKNV
jgi:DNA-binding transcriptional regulator YhcF (GntR family)